MKYCRNTRPASTLGSKKIVQRTVMCSKMRDQFQLLIAAATIKMRGVKIKFSTISNLDHFRFWMR